jgi:tRNA modification GTPase
MSLGLEDTICAIATAAGSALVGVVRISGRNAAGVVGRMGRYVQPLEVFRRASLLEGEVDLPQELGAVPVRLYWWPTARSYTREPCAELHLPGSPPILAAALEAACTAGARLARPGEFTLRAFLAGRIDLTQAEAVLGVIDAESQRQLETALAQLAGGLARPVGELHERLLDMVAQLEAGLDFVDEDIEFISRDALLAELEAVQKHVSAIAAQMRARGEASGRVRIVFWGLPNAGKSSLMNALVGDQAALVSPLPGTTRDFVTHRLRLGGREMELVDTAGIATGAHATALEAAMQQATGRQSQAADLVLLCIDRSRELSDWEQEQLAREDARRIVVWTKGDLPPAGGLARCGGMITSSQTGQGLAQLRLELIHLLDQQAGESGALVATADRCRESLTVASDALKRAAAGARGGQGEELVAAEVRLALEELGRVAGTVYTEDILDRVFSRFCIGK